MPQVYNSSDFSSSKLNSNYQDDLKSFLYVVSRRLSQRGASIVLVVQTFLRGRTALHEEIISLCQYKSHFFFRLFAQMKCGVKTEKNVLAPLPK